MTILPKIYKVDIQSTRDAAFVEFRGSVDLDDCKMHFTIQNWLSYYIIDSVGGFMY